MEEAVSLKKPHYFISLKKNTLYMKNIMFPFSFRFLRYVVWQKELKDCKMGFIFTASHLPILTGLDATVFWLFLTNFWMQISPNLNCLSRRKDHMRSTCCKYLKMLMNVRQLKIRMFWYSMLWLNYQFAYSNECNLLKAANKVIISNSTRERNQSMS